MTKPSDYFADLCADAVVERELEYRGKTRAVHFRRVTAGERVQLQQGQSVRLGGQGPAMDSVDLADFAKRKHMLVQFSLVRPDGSNVYASLAEVEALPADLVEALYALASKAFETEQDPGEA